MEGDLQPKTVTRTHPVADNLLRVLGGGKGATDATQLAEYAQELFQLADAGQPMRDEPGAAFAPRRRTPQDYTGAAAGAMDPEQLALAFAFAPDEWRGDATKPDETWPLRTANWYLLYAENGDSGEIPRSELLAQALTMWDNPGAAKEQLQLSNERAYALTGFGVCSRRLKERAADILANLADQGLVELGPQLDLGELMLLEQVRQLRWIPMETLVGYRAVEDCMPWVETITRFLHRSQVIMEREDFSAHGISDEEERRETVSLAAQTRLACQSLHDIGQLQPTRELLQEIGTRYAMLGLILGLRNGHWEEAAQLVHGLTLERLRPEPDVTLRESLGLGLRAIPLIAGHLRKPNHRILSSLESFREVFPAVGQLIDEMVNLVRARNQQQEAIRQEELPLVGPLSEPAPLLEESPAPAPLELAAIREETSPAPAAPSIEAPIARAHALEDHGDDDFGSFLSTAPAAALPVPAAPTSPVAQEQRITPLLPVAGSRPIAPPARPRILVSALGWDKNQEELSARETARILQPAASLPKEVEIVAEAHMEQAAPSEPVPEVPAEGEKQPVFELIRPSQDLPGSPAKPRKTNRFKVVSSPPPAEQALRARRTPLVEQPAAPVLATVTEEPVTATATAAPEPVATQEASPATESSQAAELAPESARPTLHDTLHAAEPEEKVTTQRKILARLAHQETAPIPPAKKVKEPLDAIPTKPIVDPRRRRDTAALDAVPGTTPDYQKHPRRAEKMLAAVDNTPAPATPLDAAPAPAAARGKSLQGRRVTSLEPENPAKGQVPMARRVQKSKGSEHRRILMRNFAILAGLIAFMGVSSVAIIHGPNFLKKYLEPDEPELASSARALASPAAAPSGDVPEPAQSEAAPARPSRVPAAAAPTEPVEENTRIARDSKPSGRPLQNFIQSQHPFSQPAEVRVLSGDLGATGQLLDQGPATEPSINDVLRSAFAVDTWAAESEAAAREQSTAGLAKIPAPAKQEAPPSRKAAEPGMELFDDVVAIMEEPAEGENEESIENVSLKVKEIIYVVLGGANDVKAAMINDWVYKEGEEIVDFSSGQRRSFKVVSIQPQEVILAGESGQIHLPYMKQAQL